MTWSDCRQWLRAVAQPSTFIGLAMVAMVWLSLAGYHAAERSAAQKGAIQNTSNLARAFELHLATTIADIDNRLLAARRAYERSPDTFSLSASFKEMTFTSGAASSANLVGADGLLKENTLGPFSGIVDLTDIDVFHFQKTNLADEVFISKPVRGRVTDKWSLYISRRVRQPDGSFGGFISVAVDPYHFVRMYESIDLGREGYIAIVGRDGIFRAVGGQAVDVVGKALVDNSFNDPNLAPSGWRYSNSEWGDGIRRLVAYRVLKAYPLMIAVALSERDIFSGIVAALPAYQFLASIITALVLIGVGFGIGGRLRLDQTRDALNEKNIWFQAALNNMRQGLCMFDRNKRVVVSNRQYAELYRLSPEDVKPGTTLEEILRTRLKNGTYIGPSPKDYIQRDAGAPAETQHLGDGRVVHITRDRMTDGGWVTTHEDITERQRYESRIKHLAHHDPLTDAANRVLLNERIAEAFARQRRNGESFALFLIDVDHFKQINDTHGHLAGDELLRTIVGRLRGCVREIDTVARIGGDEFAILQTGLDDASAAATLAQRIRSAVNEPCVIEGEPIEPRISGGISIAPRDATDPKGLFKAADLALYRSKSKGRDRFWMFWDKAEQAIAANP